MADAPRRIQRSRAKGWRMPEGAVYVGRPSIDGNPYIVIFESGSYGVWQNGSTRTWQARDRADAHDMAVSMYRRDLLAARDADPQAVGMMLARLRGQHLVCWCPLHLPCHADVLLELANAPLRCEGMDA